MEVKEEEKVVVEVEFRDEEESIITSFQEGRHFILH